jgi:ATP-dependent RNA helicase DDX35
MSGFLRPQLSSERETGDEAVSTLIINRYKHLGIRQQRELLPIFRVKRDILYLLEKFRTLVLIGGTYYSF